MKLIIAGSRTIKLSGWAIQDLLRWYEIDRRGITEVVSGGAPGIDSSGVNFAAFNPEIPIKVFPADWLKYGKAAGPIRNRQMAEYADALLLIWDGESRGSKNMKEEMLKISKPVYEVIIKKT